MKEIRENLGTELEQRTKDRLARVWGWRPKKLKDSDDRRDKNGAHSW